MPVKIRLARHGRKKFAFYHVVVADSRAPRDGKYVERIGLYNPNTNPATIELDFDKALQWLKNGAQPTDTVRTILSHEGVLMKKHLLDGVKKGAFDEAEADKRFDAWKQGREAKIQAKVEKMVSLDKTEAEKRLEAETKVNEARAAEIAKRNSALADEARAAKAKEANAAEAEKVEAEKVEVEEVAVEVVAEAEVTETVAEEAPATEEAPVAEETPVAEEAPATEAPKEPEA